MRLALSPCVAAALLAGSAQAEHALRELPTDKLVGLAPMLAHGEMALLESAPDGKMTQITVLALAAAPEPLVREVLTTPERYKEFARNLTRADVRRNPDGSIDYDLALGLGLLTLENNHRMIPRPDGAVDIVDRGMPDGAHHRWRLLPVPSGTVIVQYGYTDVRHGDAILTRLVDSTPTLEHGLALSAQLYYVRAVKERAESLARAQGRASVAPTGPGAGFRFLLERGRVAVMRSRPDGHLGDVSVLDTIYAPRAKIDAVIGDPSQYRGFVDGMKKSRLLGPASDGTVTWESEFDLSLLTWTTRFSMRRDGDAIDAIGLSGDLRGSHYRWDLTARGERETLAVFRVNQDLAAASPLILGSLFRREPLFEHGLSVALALLQVIGVRGRAEGWR